MRVHTFAYDIAADLQQTFNNEGIEDASSTLVQVFTTNTDRSYIQSVLEDIKALLPSCCLLGATTSTTILTGSIHDDLTVISVCEFDSSQCLTSYATFQKGHEPDCLNTGKELCRQVIDSDTRLLLCYATGDQINAENLAMGITADSPSLVLAGALASTTKQSDTPLVFAGTKIISSGAVLVSISGPEFGANLHHSSDWQMLGKPMQVTSVKENTLYTINSVPARSIYTRYLGREACKDLGTTCIRFPILVERNNKIIARPGKAGTQDNAIRLWGNLYEGDKVRFGILDPNAAMDQFQKFQAQLKEGRCDALFIYPSQVRKQLMRSLTEDEITRFDALAPSCGMFTVGQFFYNPRQADYLHYAETVLCMTEGPRDPHETDLDSTENPFSQDTLEMRAMSHLMNTTSRELEEANQALEVLANRDSLTRIFNRHKAQQLLDQEFHRAQRYGRPLSLIMIDIDDFKSINDNHGHAIGDKAIIGITETIKPLVRKTDYFARWGGEEFLIICPETSLPGTTETAERLRAMVAEKSIIDESRLSISLGVASYQGDDSRESLLERADQALYESKHQGKNRVTQL